MSSALDGDRALLTYEHAGGQLLLIVDLGSGRVTHQVGLTGRPTAPVPGAP